MKFVPVSPSILRGKTWSRPRDHAFAAKSAVVSIVASELAAAAAQLPLAFVRARDSYRLVALLSLERERNLFVGPTGRWITGTYIPAEIRSYPFRMLRFTGENRMGLCIDEDSELISDTDGEEIFFEDDGAPAKSIREITDFLKAVEVSRHRTDLAVKALADAGVIHSWALSLRKGESESVVEGIFRIDEKALNGLEPDTFLQLRKVGALPIAYAQLLSAGLTSAFPRLEIMHQRLAGKSPGGDMSGVSFDHLN